MLNCSADSALRFIIMANFLLVVLSPFSQEQNVGVIVVILPFAGEVSKTCDVHVKVECLYLSEYIMNFRVM